MLPQTLDHCLKNGSLPGRHMRVPEQAVTRIPPCGRRTLAVLDVAGRSAELRPSRAPAGVRPHRRGHQPASESPLIAHIATGPVMETSHGRQEHQSKATQAGRGTVRHTGPLGHTGLGHRAQHAGGSPLCPYSLSPPCTACTAALSLTCWAVAFFWKDRAALRLEDPATLQ